MQKTTTYYWLGFTSAITPIALSFLLALAGYTERGSGRFDFGEIKVASAIVQAETQETDDKGTQTKGDREPEKGGGRRN